MHYNRKGDLITHTDHET